MRKGAAELKAEGPTVIDDMRVAGLRRLLVLGLLSVVLEV